ncbi:hypothetical protein C9890_0656 [Perkinsus sp. BL_2016]|nr:hypothetical protein C9890_0656 [Perkinsus sp. BL_2016]
MFVKGGGPGGQAVNKSNNAVWVRHIPTGFQVKVRARSGNRNYCINDAFTYIGTYIHSKKKALDYGKFAAKTLERNAKRCSKEEAAEKTKLKKAIEKQNFEGAKIHAESAIRKKNEALNYLRLASRIDGVASQVQTAVSMRTVSKSMASVVDGLNRALEGNQMEKVSLIMDKFEGQVENLNVQTSYMESAMSNSAALTTPSDQVHDLMQQVADEHGLELGSQLGNIPMVTASPMSSSSVAANKEVEDQFKPISIK